MFEFTQYSVREKTKTDKGTEIHDNVYKS